MGDRLSAADRQGERAPVGHLRGDPGGSGIRQPAVAAADHWKYWYPRVTLTIWGGAVLAAFIVVIIGLAG